MKPLVYVSRVIPEPGMKLLYESCDVILHEERDVPPTREELLSKSRDCVGALVLLTEKIDREFLDNATKLRVVSTMSVGFDHIDLDYATSKGITVTHTPDVLTEATADYAFALLLAASRRVAEGDRFVRSGQWNKPWSPYLLLGNDVHGRTLGIVGMGRIGKEVARRASGFNMNVIYFDRKGPLPNLEPARYCEFDDLLGRSDFISLHIPLDRRTAHMFGEREFSLMKKSAIFVNASRGGIIQTSALHSALEQKKIFAAGLDVFEEEPINPKNPLLKLDNVILSPHLGSASIQARSQMSEMAAMNLISALNGDLPRSLANTKDLRR